MPGLKKITANSFTWLVGQVLNKLSGLVLVIVAARLLGEESFGKYTVVMAYYVIVNVIVDFGMRPLIIREVARDKSLASHYLVAACVFKSILTLGSVFLLIPFLKLTNTPHDTMLGTIFAVSALLPFALSQTLSSFYIAYERMYYEAFIVIIGQLLWVSIAILLLYLGSGIVLLFKVLFLVNCIILTINLFIFINRFFKPTLIFDVTLMKSMARQAFPFALTSAFAILYFRVDTLMLAMFRGEVEVSWYGLAYRFTDAVQFIPISLMISLYPIVSRLFVNDKKAMQLLVEKSYQYLFVIGLPISAGLALTSDKVILLFFKDAYQPSIGALCLLSWSLLPLFLNAILITTMNAANCQARVTRATVISLVFNIVGNALVIPFMGLYGACLTTIVSEMIITVILRRELEHRFGLTFPRVSQQFSPLAATLIMSGVLWTMLSYHLLLIVPVGILCYSGVVLLTKGIYKEDILLFKNALIEKEVPR